MEYYLCTNTHVCRVRFHLHTHAAANTIQPYWIMWCLSVLDLYDATGDRQAFLNLTSWIEQRLDHGVVVAGPNGGSLTWSRDDERMGFGAFCCCVWLELGWTCTTDVGVEQDVSYVLILWCVADQQVTFTHVTMKTYYDIYAPYMRTCTVLPTDDHAFTHACRV